MEPQSPPTAFSINGVRADLSSESLRGPDGGIVPVRPQAFATLRYLLQNPNRLVTKTELMRAVWRGTSVTDDSLVQCIHEIRRALKDERHDILQTVSRRGYRIVLPEKINSPMPANRASLAVLPFTNLNRDPEQDYFADGLAEDLITDLARIPGLFVIARNSSFSYRGQPRDVRRVARNWGFAICWKAASGDPPIKFASTDNSLMAHRQAISGRANLTAPSRTSSICRTS